METLTFNTNSEFKRAFNTLSGNSRPGQLKLDQIDSINGVKVNETIYAKAIIDITNGHGPQFFNDDVERLQAPYVVVMKKI